jgi:hypothetical protein
MAEEVEGVGDKGTGDINSGRYRDTLGEHSNILLRSAFTDAKTSRLGTIFHSCGSIKISGIPASGLKESYGM